MNNLCKNTPPSVVKIYELISSYDRPLHLKEIQLLTNFSYRSIRRAIKQLDELNLIIKLPDLTDLRSYKIGRNK